MSVQEKTETPPADGRTNYVDAAIATIRAHAARIGVKAITVAALATQHATERAGEADVRARLQAKIRAGHCFDDSEDGDVNFCGECDWCLHILADRALQPDLAVSDDVRVMREALEQIAKGVRVTLEDGDEWISPLAARTSQDIAATAIARAGGAQ